MTVPAPLDLTHPTALAPAGQVLDWRLTVTFRWARETGVWDALPGSVPALAASTGLTEDAVRTVLDVLTVWGFVETDQDGVVRRGPQAPGEDDAATIAQHGVWVHRWSSMLGDRLRDRLAPPPEALCKPSTRDGLRLLARASRRSITPVVDACLEAVPHARRALDLGGGHGEYSLELARRGVDVVLQDLPGVIDLAREDSRFAGISLVAASLFDSVAEGPFDLVLCSTVTNMFGESENKVIAERLRSAVGDGGVAVVSTYLRDRSAVGTFFGVQMRVATDGGDSHTSLDHRRWLTDAGFGQVDVVDLASPPLSLVIARVGSGAESP